MNKHLLVLLGTRPEAIKLFPVIHRLKLEGATATVCATAQHRELLDQVLRIANIVPEIDLDIMKPNQSLEQLSANLLLGIGKVLDELHPDRVIVQGDTSTAMIGALSAYYRRIPVSHVEAGLRSGNIYAPWPEEINRKIVGTIADQHFAPTQRAADLLLQENVPSSQIYITGNTVVDALLTTKTLIESDPQLRCRWHDIKQRQRNRRLILVTTHRRENFGLGMDRIGEALLKILKRPDVAIIVPMHPNPAVRQVLGARLKDHEHAEIIEPQQYIEFVSLLLLVDLVLTDSGGIQEEAPSLGKPVLVMRDTTERPEGIAAGTAQLVGTDPDRIVSETQRLLEDNEHYLAMSRAHNPFGDGRASERIVKIILGNSTKVGAANSGTANAYLQEQTGHVSDAPPNATERRIPDMVPTLKG